MEDRDEMKLHGGAREGAGRPAGQQQPPLDDARRCTHERPDGTRCGNAASLGSPDNYGRCRFHGGATNEARAAVAQQEVAAVMAMVDPSLPVPTVKDFPAVAAAYVHSFNTAFARAEAELDKQRADMTEIELTRAFEDIMGRQERRALLVTKLMDSAARLGISAAAQEAVDLATHPRWARLQAAIMEALVPFPDARAAVLQALIDVEAVQGTDLL